MSENGNGLGPEEPEGPIAARDGAETPDELARRRAGRQSIADRAAETDADLDETDDEQLFVWEQGRKVTLASLIARNITVEHAFVFGGKRLKGRGGLIAFDDDVLVLVRGRVAKTSLVPTRDDQERVTKVVIETHIRSHVIVPADSDEAASLLAPILEARSVLA